MTILSNANQDEALTALYRQQAMAYLLAEAIFSERSEMWDAYLARGGKHHTREQCRASKKAGGPKNCVLHNPSKHKMRDWPLILRSSTLLERQCQHRVGHPDPDSAAYLNWATKQTSWDVHACDGCCRGA